MSDKLDFQVFFEEKDAEKLSVGVLALSVTFGASSPKGGASGVPVRPTRDEQSLIFFGNSSALLQRAAASGQEHFVKLL